MAKETITINVGTRIQEVVLTKKKMVWAQNHKSKKASFDHGEEYKAQGYFTSAATTKYCLVESDAKIYAVEARNCSRLEGTKRKATKIRIHSTRGPVYAYEAIKESKGGGWEPTNTRVLLSKTGGKYEHVGMMQSNAGQHYVFKANGKHFATHEGNVTESITESYYRLPSKVINNDLYIVTDMVDSFYKSAKAGNDIKHEELKNIIKHLQGIEKKVKKFKSGEIPTGLYEGRKRNMHRFKDEIPPNFFRKLESFLNYEIHKKAEKEYHDIEDSCVADFYGAGNRDRGYKLGGIEFEFKFKDDHAAKKFASDRSMVDYITKGVLNILKDAAPIGKFVRPTVEARFGGVTVSFGYISS